jgi:anti-anti-sigma factor
MTVPDFELRIVRGGGRLQLVPCGELDIATAGQLERAVDEATAGAVAELVLDLRELTFMDSTGLRTLAQANVKAGQAGTALSIWRGPRQIERVLEISGLGPLLPLADAPAD